MPKYETLPTLAFKESPVVDSLELPEVVHLDDPALTVMLDFKQMRPPLINPDMPIDDALNEMKMLDLHDMLVINKHEKIIGLISREDILGEKPITLIQERGISRGEIFVKMVMTPILEIVAFDIEALGLAKVGNVINTLQQLRQHYALVVHINEDKKPFVRGLFSLSQISKQLHMRISNGISRAETIAELQKRHK